MLKCDVVEPEEKTITRFMGGLKKEIADVIQLQLYWTFNDVRKLTMNVEQQRKCESKATSRPYFSNQGNASSSGMKTFVKGTSSKVSKLDSKWASTAKPVRTSNSSWKCFKCQGCGHIAFECPKQRVVTILEEEFELEKKNEDPQKEDNLEEVVEHADEGEVLVCQ